MPARLKWLVFAVCSSVVCRSAVTPESHSRKAEKTALVAFRQATNGSTPAGWIQLGTPKKWLLVIFDTGSDKLVAKTWETVSAELSSVDQGIADAVVPSKLLYDHGTSVSYHRKVLKNPVTGKDVPKESSITYGSGSALTEEGTETVFVGNRQLSNFTLMEIKVDSLQLLHTSDGLAGVLGLQHMKNKSLGNSLFSHLRDQDLMTSFGYCRGAGDNGTFIWGDSSEEGHELEVIGQMHWAVKLGSLKLKKHSEKSPSFAAKSGKANVKEVNGKGMAWPFDNDGSDAALDDDEAKGKDDADVEIEDAEKALDDIAKKIFGGRAEGQVSESKPTDHDKVLLEACPDDKCVAILDSGSNIIAGPTDVITSITKLVDIKQDCSNFDSLPHLEFKMGGMPVSIPPAGYVMKVAMPEWSGGAMGYRKSTNGADEAWRGQSGSIHGLDQISQNAFQESSALDHVDVSIDVEPGSVHRHRPDLADSDMALSEQRASSVRAATNRRWKAVFERLHRDYDIDLRALAKEAAKNGNHTNSNFMCMPALVPLDKKTPNGGALWIVGTPLLDAYYARWSFAKGDKSPKIFLKPLQDTKVCKNEKDVHVSVPVQSLVRTEAKDGAAELLTPPLIRSRGLTARLPEEIAYPHWAKDLLHV